MTKRGWKIENGDGKALKSRGRAQSLHWLENGDGKSENGDGKSRGGDGK